MKKSILIFAILGVVLISSCKKEIKGCKDSSAANYNSKATKDDGSCQYSNNALSNQLDVNFMTWDISGTGVEGCYNNEVEIFLDNVKIGTPTLFNTGSSSPCANNSYLPKILLINKSYNVKLKQLSTGIVLYEANYVIKIKEEEGVEYYDVEKEVITWDNCVEGVLDGSHCNNLYKWFFYAKV